MSELEIVLENNAEIYASSAAKAEKVSLSSDAQKRDLLFYIVTGLFLAYTFLPMLSVLLFSLAKKWTTTLLPEAWSLNAYISILNNREFILSLGRSCVVASVSALIGLTVVTLALLGASLKKNKTIVGIMEAICIIPVALPGIVLALSCIIFYGRVFPMILGRPILLIFAEAAFSLPFVFWTMRNTFRGLEIMLMYEAACTLGAPVDKFITRILLPNIGKGLLASGVMAFTIALNNFALAQLLVGAGWKTLPLFQHTIMRTDGHQTSAIAIVSITLTFILTTIFGVINMKTLSKGLRA